MGARGWACAACLAPGLGLGLGLAAGLLVVARRRVWASAGLRMWALLGCVAAPLCQWQVVGLRGSWRWGALAAGIGFGACVGGVARGPGGSVLGKGVVVEVDEFFVVVEVVESGREGLVGGVQGVDGADA